jgi:hypothetical protein
LPDRHRARLEAVQGKRRAPIWRPWCALRPIPAQELGVAAHVDFTDHNLDARTTTRRRKSHH